jgi:hypothetical protein
MTHENTADEGSLAPQASSHQFKIIKNFDHFSKRILESHRGQLPSTADGSLRAGQGNDRAPIGTSEHAAPIDKFAYLSIRQSQGAAVARANFQKDKVIKTDPITLFL